MISEMGFVMIHTTGLLVVSDFTDPLCIVTKQGCACFTVVRVMMHTTGLLVQQ